MNDIIISKTANGYIVRPYNGPEVVNVIKDWFVFENINTMKTWMEENFKVED